MILVDANLLIYAVASSLPQHGTARMWLDEKLNGREQVGLPWPSLLAFLRITTNPRAFARPLTPEAALERMTAWLSAEPVWIPQPTDDHAEVLGSLVRATRATANLVPDAHLAALALEHGLVVCSTDGDFARFPGLRWNNPIA